jgi:hypothetical protein
MRKIVGALACALVSLSARATNFSTDASDLWWNASESGWGVNVMQQYDTLFMTFFVYGSNNVPTWYVAPAVVYTSVSGGTLTYTGALYQTAGPWFGGSFNPANVSNRIVGSVTFNLASPTAATLTYSVDGVNVSKSLTRQVWTAENFTGSYVGGQTGTLSGCSANGTNEEVDVLTITQSGTSFSLVAANLLANVSCTFTGTYSQAGHVGAVSGNYQCTTGTGGTFSLQELEGTLAGFTSRFTSANGGCTFTGRMAGARRAS